MAPAADTAFPFPHSPVHISGKQPSYTSGEGRGRRQQHPPPLLSYDSLAGPRERCGCCQALCVPQQLVSDLVDAHTVQAVAHNQDDGQGATQLHEQRQQEGATGGLRRHGAWWRQSTARCAGVEQQCA